MRVLVVEDDKKIASFVVKGLKQNGFAADHAADGEEGLFLTRSVNYDAAIVDLMLPKLDGLSLIQKIRTSGSRVPVLILSAKASVEDRVKGLQAGGDDYLTKPFAFSELLARVQALIRRAAGYADPVLRAGPITLDTRTQAVSVEGRAVELTSFEYRMLEYLMLRAGQVVSKGELVDKLYEHDAERDSNTIEVFVGRLRRKLDPEDRFHPIETLRGRGYRLQPEAPAADPARA